MDIMHAETVSETESVESILNWVRKRRLPFLANVKDRNWHPCLNGFNQRV